MAMIIIFMGKKRKERRNLRGNLGNVSENLLRFGYLFVKKEKWEIEAFERLLFFI